MTTGENYKVEFKSGPTSYLSWEFMAFTNSAPDMQQLKASLAPSLFVIKLEHVVNSHQRLVES